MCPAKEIKLTLAIPLVLLGILFVMNIPELRRYLRISGM
jgi:hypothetical protein